MRANSFLNFSYFFLGIFFLIGMSHAAPVVNDGETLAVLIVANENEISGADEALKKAISPQVKQYAGMLKTEHTQNLKQTLDVKKQTGITPQDTEIVIALQQSGKKQLEELTSLKEKAFETAYIDAMVSDHTNLLHLIDNNLLKNTTNPAVKNLLLATRPHIESHLKQAQLIQKRLTLQIN